MNKIILRGIVGFGMLFLAFSTASAENSRYVGGGLGKATWDLEVTPWSIDPYELEDGPAFRGFVGMRQDYLGAEAEVSVSIHDWDTTDYNASHSAVHLIVSGVGYIPLTSAFDVYAKIGFNMWSTNVEINGRTFDGDDGIDIATGFGVNIHITEEFMIRFEHQSLPGMSDGIDDGDIEQNTINFAISL